ncbi:MAG: glycosyltransferase 87 family protein [Candidatus Promineifilaceae bacterium]
MTERRQFSGRRRLVLAALFLATLAWFLYRVAAPSAGRLTAGFGAYYTAASLARAGPLPAEVYAPGFFRPLVERAMLGQASDIYTNPPTTALAFWPLAGLGAPLARQVWTAANVLLLFLAVGLLLRAYPWRDAWAGGLILGGLALLFRPVVSNVASGQLYILILALLAAAALAFNRGRDGRAGLALAAVAALKALGGPLVALAGWLGRWRLALSAGLALGLLFLLTLPLLPLATWQAYLAQLGEVTSGPWVCVTAYQTTRSLLCHLLTYDPVWNPAPVAEAAWLANGLYALIFLASLAAVLALARRRPEAAFAALAAWEVLLRPLGEGYHHTQMLLPLAWLLAAWQAGRLDVRGLRLAVLAGILLYCLPYPYTHPRLGAGWLALLAYPRLAAGWLLFLAILLAARRSQKEVEPAELAG